MAHRYFKATDGKVTVFRASATREYSGALFCTDEVEGIAVRVWGIGFSNAGRGSHPTVEITKAEYDALQAAKVERVKATGKDPRHATSPQDSWVRNSTLEG